MKQIAVVIELEWPVNRHYHVYAGIQAYAATKPDWELFPDNFPEAVLSGQWPLRHYDGLIGRITPSALQAAQAAGLPVVNTWLNSPCVDKTPNVFVDLGESVRLAVAHLVDRGFQHLAHIGLPDDRSTDAQAEMMQVVAAEYGLTLSLHRSGHRRHPDKVSLQNFSLEVLDWVGSWAAAGRLPMGVVTSYDMLGSDMAVMLKRFGWSVPDQVAIVATGNSQLLCTTTRPTLSSIDLNFFRNGYEAARMLDDLMQGGAPPKKPMLVSPKELQVRQSSDVYAMNDRAVAQALEFMAENYGEAVSVEDVAEATGLGRRTLERRFRSVTGDSVSRRLNAMRVERAKRLLLDTNEPVKSIYAEAGFGCEKQMRETFRKVTGLTPLAFREGKREPRMMQW